MTKYNKKFFQERGRSGGKKKGENRRKMLIDELSILVDKKKLNWYQNFSSNDLLQEAIIMERKMKNEKSNN